MSFNLSFSLVVLKNLRCFSQIFEGSLSKVSISRITFLKDQKALFQVAISVELHVLCAPFVSLLLLSHLVHPLSQKFLLKPIASVHTIPPVSRPDVESIRRWHWSLVLRHSLCLAFCLGPLLPHVLQHWIVSMLNILQMILPILVINAPSQRLRHFVKIRFHLLPCRFHLCNPAIPSLKLLFNLLGHLFLLLLRLQFCLLLSQASADFCHRIFARHFVRQSLHLLSLPVLDHLQLLLQVPGVLQSCLLSVQSLLHTLPHTLPYPRWGQVRIGSTVASSSSWRKVGV